MNAMCWADRNVSACAEFEAFVAGDRVWTSAAVADRVARMASALVATGVAPGDRVLLWLPNGPDLAIAWRAVLRAGAVTVVAHHDSPLGRVRQLAAETAATAIVTSAGRVDLEPLGPAIRHRFHVGDPFHDGHPFHQDRGIAGDPRERSGWHDVDRLVADHAPLVEPIPRLDRDVASIMFTSGSTGTPKGFVTRHDALAARLRQPRAEASPLVPAVRHLAVLPMSSAFGSGPFSVGLTRRRTVCFLGLDHFEPEQVLAAIERYRIERTSLVPAMCEALLAVLASRRYDLSSLRKVSVGGACTSADLVDRLEAALGTRVAIQVQYGLSGIGFVSETSRGSRRGSVGRLNSALDAKVIDPRGGEVETGAIGELVLRPKSGSPVERWSLESFSPGSPRSPCSPEPIASAGEWFRTGDLVRLDPDGELYVVGRADDLIIQGGHNIHGQAVAEIVQRLPGVRECAVVGVPGEYLGQEAVACLALEDGARLTSSDVIAYCREHIEARGVPAGVLFVEALPRNEAGKVRNHELRAMIQAARESVHETDLVRRLSAAPASSRLDLLREEMRGLLGEVLREADPVRALPGTAFVDMGLDSLGAVEFANALSDLVGRQVPTTLAYRHPTIDASCGFLLELLGLRSAADDEAVGAVGASPLADAGALRLADVLSPAELHAALPSPAASRLSRPARVVFLTGANGFLGRFLVQEILQKLPHDGGRLYCLVRAADDAAALARLRATYGSDPSLHDLFDRLVATGRLAVFGGDFTKPRFGLPEDTYARLSHDVDCVVHNGAVVNHLLGYRDLFAPNVLGTVEAIRFALAGRRKAINYVSTMAVPGMTGKARAVSHGVKDGAAGYAFSKWTSERLLKDLHDRSGVPVRIYRPSWIMAHREYAGQINTQDAFTRLLQGIVTTSLAPRSFYARGRSAEGAHHDGLPVDVVARSIAALAMAGVERPGYVEYHVVNPHRDVSLDAIVDWVKSAGYRIEQIDDYAAWYRAFRNRLGSLSRSRQRQSPLPLIHTWERPRRDAGIPERAAAGEASEIPGISEAFIHKCLKDMCSLGLIDPAA